MDDAQLKGENGRSFKRKDVICKRSHSYWGVFKFSQNSNDQIE
jgi:hypothetical protein